MGIVFFLNRFYGFFVACFRYAKSVYLLKDA